MMSRLNSCAFQNACRGYVSGGRGSGTRPNTNLDVGVNHVVGTHTLRIVGLRGAPSEGIYLRSHGLREENGIVPDASHADDAYLLSRAAPVHTERVEDGEPTAHHRRSMAGLDFLRDREHEAFMRPDARGKPALARKAVDVVGVLKRSEISNLSAYAGTEYTVHQGEHNLRTVVLVTPLARTALAAARDPTADADTVARAQALDQRADARHLPDNLMSSDGVPVAGGAPALVQDVHV